MEVGGRNKAKWGKRRKRWWRILLDSDMVNDDCYQADLEEALRTYKVSRGKAGLFGLGK